MKTLSAILTGLLMLTAVFFLGRCTAPVDVEPLIGRADTVTLWDTMTIERPIVTTEYVYGTIEIPSDSLVFVSSDTLFVLPRQVREYGTEDYHAVVSGYDPVLESLDIYRKERIVTERIYPKPKMNSVYVSATAGYYDVFSYSLSAGYARRFGAMELFGEVGRDFGSRKFFVEVGANFSITF